MAAYHAQERGRSEQDGSTPNRASLTTASTRVPSKTAGLEAQRQNAMESDSAVGWIATKSPDGQWVARRVPSVREEN
jgi:hypothetical protein